tara:strand:+ start:328 stop:1089 length:762 start_codon:yes stop_codon:yes gene_type:complete
MIVNGYVLFSIKRYFIFAPLLFAAMLVSSCSKQLVDYNYKITVEVETPEGLVSGHAVRRVQVRESTELSIPSPGSLRTKTIGEAVAVDLPNGETLFTLVSLSDSTTESAIVPEDWVAPEGQKYSEAVARYLAARKDQSFQLARDRWEPGYKDKKHPKHISNYPLFVRFRDVDDPKTIEFVDPDDLTFSFGNGYDLKGITVQITDEHVTQSILARLPWLNRQTGSLAPTSIGASDEKQQLATITEWNFYRGPTQ